MAVVGATGTGKSDFGVRLALGLAASGVASEIVNADAMQLYRGMDIGTAKLPPAERRGVPHHLLDVLDPTAVATVAAYQREARAVIGQIVDRGAVPVVVGGSGLYVSALIHDFAFPGGDPQVRARLEGDLTRDGLVPLVERLRERDPASAAQIDLRNPRRVVRALEVAELRAAQSDDSGSSGPRRDQSAPQKARGRLPEQPIPVRPTIEVRLGIERAALVERLDRRVERMWAAGLLEEVAALMPGGLGVTASRAIGYAQALAQLRGDLSRAESIAETQRLTRRFARRQVSWFRRYPDARLVDAMDPAVVAASLGALAAGILDRR